MEMEGRMTTAAHLTNAALIDEYDKVYNDLGGRDDDGRLLIYRSRLPLWNLLADELERRYRIGALTKDDWL